MKKTLLLLLALLLLVATPVFAGEYEPQVTLSAFFFTETHDNGFFMADYSPTVFDLPDGTQIEPIISFAHFSFLESGSEQSRSFVGCGVKITWGVRQ